MTSRLLLGATRACHAHAVSRCSGRSSLFCRSLHSLPIIRRVTLTPAQAVSDIHLVARHRSPLSLPLLPSQTHCVHIATSQQHSHTNTNGVNTNAHTDTGRPPRWTTLTVYGSLIAVVILLYGPLSSTKSDHVVTIPPTPVFLPPLANLPIQITVPDSLLSRAWHTLSFTVRTLLRLPVLGFLWTPLLLSYPLLPTQWWYNYFKRVLEWSGPVFVKFGQWASTRPDVFNDDFVAALASLQSSVHSHSYSYTEDIIERTFGKQAHHRLIVDKTLIGSGSMAQVHHGRIIDDNGEKIEVAIKILHPSTPSRIETDLFIMRCGAKLLHWIPGNEFLSLPETIEQFHSLIEQHCDLTGEAHNLDRFRRNFQSWDNIHFPSPVWSYVSDKVVVETLERGVPLNEFLKLAAPSDGFTVTFPASPNIPAATSTSSVSPFYNAASVLSTSLQPSHLSGGDNGTSVLIGNVSINTAEYQAALIAHNQHLARLGMRMFLKMMIDDNFIHSDLHPGNLIVNVKPQYKKQLPVVEGQLTVKDLLMLPPEALSLTVIDTALVTELGAKNRENFLSLFGAIVEGDGKLAARLMKENAREEHVLDEAAYEHEMDALVKLVPELNLKQTDIGQLLQRCLNIVRNHRVKIESDFASLVMSLIVVEGVGRKLDPEMSIVKESIPVLLKNHTARKILWDKCGLGLVNSMTLKAALS